MTAITLTSGPHQSPQSSLPPLAMKQLNTALWGAGGNTCTISDPNIHANSVVLVQVTGATPPADFWAVAVSQGQVVITSGSGESSTLAISYIVL